jgi:hypothetical protein
MYVVAGRGKLTFYLDIRIKQSVRALFFCSPRRKVPRKEEGAETKTHSEGLISI